MNQSPASRVLVIDDDRYITTTLSQALGNQYAVRTAASAAGGLDKARSANFDLIILDLNLPDAPGLSVCRQLREAGLCQPILVLSGDGQPLSKIALLDAGADDYLTKPFSLGELKARLRVLLRRAAKVAEVPSSHKALQVHDLRLESTTMEVIRDNVRIPLRRKEYALLECLMQHAGVAVTRDLLCSRIWQGTDDNWTNTIDVHIKFLRDKIDRPFGTPYIHTVHGVGYRLDGRQQMALYKYKEEKE